MAIIELENLVRRFGDFTAVKGISLQVAPGEIFGFLGPNGAGKSTTIRMLCTLLRPTSGRARVAGFDVLRQPGHVREKIGLVAEKLILYDRLTAAENLALFGGLHHLPAKTIRERTDYWLERLQMTPWRDRLVGSFSTGMKQRVNIARALLNAPEILFLDEPTLGLDPQTTRSIRDFIVELGQEGKTIILTTHQMNEAEMLCHRIGIIDHGQLVALGTPGELKRQFLNDQQLGLELEVAPRSEKLTVELKGQPGVLSVQEEGEILHLQLENQAVLATILRFLETQSVEIRRFATKAPTLEDVFLKLTGRQIRDEATESVPSGWGHRWRRANRRVR